VSQRGVSIQLVRAHASFDTDVEKARRDRFDDRRLAGAYRPSDAEARDHLH